MTFGGATIAQPYRIVELMNPGRIPNIMILIGTNKELQELGRGRISMGINDGMPIYHYPAEVQMRDTDRLHRSDELENFVTDGQEEQPKGHQME